jgi:Tfp pilus assembly protein PilN
MPAGSSRGGGFSSGGFGPSYAVLGVLVAVLAMVVVYVTSSNSIAQKRTELASLRQQVSEERATAGRLTAYTTFAQLAENRVATVRQIAASRFDWHAALSDLAQVMPTGASLQSLTATVAPGASVSGASGAAGGLGTGGLRAAINAPAFELHGCDRSHDDVARLISRLRVMNGVQRVTLADSLRQNPAQAAGATTVANPGASTAAVRSVCGLHPAQFDLVVFFTPLPGASPVAGATGTAPANNPSSSTPVSTASAPAAGTTPTAAGTTPAAAGGTPTGTAPATAGSTPTPGASGAPAASTAATSGQPVSSPAGAAPAAGAAARPASTPTSGSSR